MGINIAELKQHINSGEYVDIDLTIGKVQLCFVGGKLPEENNENAESQLTWNFEIEEARTKYITKDLIIKLKAIAEELHDGKNVIGINFYPEVAKKAKDLLIEEGFHQWVEDEEDHGYWWETSTDKGEITVGEPVP